MLLRLVTLILAAVLMLPSQADDDHERSRKALLAGEVLPLRVILESVEKNHPGQVLEVELERDQGLWIYEIKLLSADGRLVKLYVNGKDGSILNSKIKKMKPPHSRPLPPHRSQGEHENFNYRR